MSLKQEFLAALNSGSTDQSLLQLVSRHQAAGLAPQRSYEILEEIWTEYGFDKKDDGDRLRQSLEYITEKVWYQGDLRAGAGLT